MHGHAHDVLREEQQFVCQWHMLAWLVLPCGIARIAAAQKSELQPEGCKRARKT